MRLRLKENDRKTRDNDEQDCYELIRFMIQFDRMDMGDIQTMLSS